MERGLDGVYFRVERGGKWVNRCFSDLTEDEKDTVLENKSEAYLKSLCKHLSNVIIELGDTFDIVNEA